MLHHLVQIDALTYVLIYNFDAVDVALHVFEGCSMWLALSGRKVEEWMNLDICG